MSNKLGVFLAGGLAGAAIALLYAPRSGRESRALVSEKLNEAWGEAQELSAQGTSGVSQAAQNVAAKGQAAAQSAAAKGQEFYGKAVERGQAVAQGAVERGQAVAQSAAAKGQEIYGKAAARVQDAAEGAKPVVDARSDELREKIEAARQRIAAQVVQNAEESQIIDGGTVDVIADEPAAETPVEVVEEAPAEAAAPAEED